MAVDIADFRTVRAVSRTLKQLLEDAITTSAEVELPHVPIGLGSPKEMNGTDSVSLWLYQVMSKTDLLSAPPLPRRQVGLALELHYLVSPVSDDAEKRQVLFGRLVQTLSDHAVVRGSQLRDVLAGSDEELRIRIQTRTFEELTLMWGALGVSYEPSLTCVVTAART